MSLTYPHSCNLGTAATTLTFADGLVIVIPAGAFTTTTAVVIDKVAGQGPCGKQSVSACYALVCPNGAPIAINREIGLIVPTTQAVDPGASYDFYYNPVSYHDPDSWLPTEDVPTREATYLLAGALPHWAPVEATKR